MAEGEGMVQGGEGRFSSGYMLYPAGPGDASGGGATTAFGHAGLGGSVALGDARHGVAVAVTLNRLGWDTSATTGRLIRAVYKGLRLPVPAAYLEAGGGSVPAAEIEAAVASN